MQLRETKIIKCDMQCMPNHAKFVIRKRFIRFIKREKKML